MRPKMQHLSHLTPKIQHLSQLTCRMRHLRHNDPKTWHLSQHTECNISVRWVPKCDISVSWYQKYNISVSWHTKGRISDAMIQKWDIWVNIRNAASQISSFSKLAVTSHQIHTQCKLFARPDGTTFHPDVSRNIRAKAKKAPMCSVHPIAIELKGLAAPGEALKNQRKSLILNWKS